MTRSEIDELHRRLAQLETENAALRSTVDPRVEPAAPARTPRRRGWGRSLLAVILIALGAALAPIAVVAAWANVQLTDTERFVAGYAPLADDPAVQALVATQVVSAIEEQTDIPALTEHVIDGVIDLGTGPAATRALELLKGPAAQGLQSLLTGVVDRFVESEAFANVWAAALRVSHSQVVGALQNDPAAAVEFSQDGTIGIRLAPIIDAVKEVLADQGVGFASAIPTVDRTIAIAESESLGTVRLAYSLAVAAGLWLPWVALSLLAAGVLAARRRSVALVAASASLASVMVILIAGFAIGRVFFDTAIRPSAISAEAGGVLYDTVIRGMRDTTIAVLVLALVAAAVAWFCGPFDIPRRLRGAVHAAAARLRNSLSRRGLDTGRVGEWLHRQRVLLRVVIAVIGAAIVLLVRPLTPTLTLWTLALSALAVLVLEVIERPPTDPVRERAADPSVSVDDVRAST